MKSRKTLARSVSGLIALVAAGAISVNLSSAQSLAELAKQEEARRKTIQAPSKIYTNESIRAAPAPAQPAPAATPGAPAPAGAPAVPPSPSGVEPPAASVTQPDPGAGQAPAEDSKKDEAFWRQRIEAARDALQRAETFADALQSRINALSTDFVARDDPAQREVIAADRQKALAELDRVRQEIQQHTKAIAGIQDEARRAGAPPGWLR